MFYVQAISENNVKREYVPLDSDYSYTMYSDVGSSSELKCTQLFEAGGNDSRLTPSESLSLTR